MHVTLIGDKTGVFVNPVDCGAAVDYEKTANFAAVQMDGVNNLVVANWDSQMKIIQAGGFTPDRGLFNDLY